jgi:hypothetical protein
MDQVSIRIKVGYVHAELAVRCAKRAPWLPSTVFGLVVWGERYGCTEAESSTYVPAGYRLCTSSASFSSYLA